MYKVGLIPLVHFLAGLLHILGQSRWSAAEYTNFAHLIKKKERKCKITNIFGVWAPYNRVDEDRGLYHGVDLLQWAEEGHKGWTAKVGDGAQAGEEAAVPHFLKVTLAHVLSAHSVWGHKGKDWLIYKELSLLFLRIVCLRVFQLRGLFLCVWLHLQAGQDMYIAKFADNNSVTYWH